MGGGGSSYSGPSAHEIYVQQQQQAQRREAERQRQIQAQQQEQQRQLRIQQERDRQARETQLKEQQRRDRERQRKINEKNARLAAQVKEAQEKARLAAIERAKKYDNCEKKNQGDFLKHVEKLERPKKTKKFSVAFLGPTCAGKTTLINTLVGKIVSKPCPLRNTTGINKVFENAHLQLFDVFGTNDSETYHNFDILRGLMEVHLVICLYVNSVDSTVNLARLLSAASCKVHFTLNKIDLYEKEDRQLLLNNDTNILKKICPECTNGQTSSTQTIGIQDLKLRIKLK